MTDLRKAATAALEALEGFEQFRRIMTDGPDASDKVFAEDHAEAAFLKSATATPALRAALAAPEPVPEPVFWYRPCSDNTYEGPIHNVLIEPVRKASGAWVPLYAAAPPTQPVRLTDERLLEIAQTMGKRERGVSDYESWGQGYARDAAGEFRVPQVPAIAIRYARAVEAAVLAGVKP